MSNDDKETEEWPPSPQAGQCGMRREARQRRGDAAEGKAKFKHQEATHIGTFNGEEGFQTAERECHGEGSEHVGTCIPPASLWNCWVIFDTAVAIMVLSSGVKEKQKKRPI